MIDNSERDFALQRLDDRLACIEGNVSTGSFELSCEGTLIRCGLTINTRRGYADHTEEIFAGPTWADVAAGIP